MSPARAVRSVGPLAAETITRRTSGLQGRRSRVTLPTAWRRGAAPSVGGVRDVAGVGRRDGVPYECTQLGGVHLVQ